MCQHCLPKIWLVRALLAVTESDQYSTSVASVTTRKLFVVDVSAKYVHVRYYAFCNVLETKFFMYRKSWMWNTYGNTTRMKPPTFARARVAQTWLLIYVTSPTIACTKLSSGANHCRCSKIFR